MFRFFTDVMMMFFVIIVLTYHLVYCHKLIIAPFLDETEFAPNSPRGSLWPDHGGFAVLIRDVRNWPAFGSGRSVFFMGAQGFSRDRAQVTGLSAFPQFTSNPSSSNL